MTGVQTCALPILASSAPSPQAPESRSRGEAAPIVLFDGHCNFCSGVVNFLLARDARGVLRFAALQSSFQRWAAAADYVFATSAAESGGSRHLRFVTTPASGGGCVPTILSVTVPAGSLATLNTEVTALTNAGFSAPNRKYLLWTDAAVMCGQSSIYYDDKGAQTTYTIDFSDYGSSPKITAPKTS